MLKILQGGHFQKKGYNYALYLTFPSYSSTMCKSITGSDQVTKKLEMSSGFLLTTNNLYSNILFRLFGFGIGLEIHSRG